METGTLEQDHWLEAYEQQRKRHPEPDPDSNEDIRSPRHQQGGRGTVDHNIITKSLLPPLFAPAPLFFAPFVCRARISCRVHRVTFSDDRRSNGG
jgi:hypothetical protein